MELHFVIDPFGGGVAHEFVELVITHQAHNRLSVDASIDSQNRPQGRVVMQHHAVRRDIHDADIEHFDRDIVWQKRRGFGRGWRRALGAPFGRVLLPRDNQPNDGCDGKQPRVECIEVHRLLVRFGCIKAIANATDGLHICGGTRIGFDFFAEPTYMHVDGPTVTHIITPPDTLEQDITRQREATIAHHAGE
jgi:hypothetical protein